MLQEAFIVVVMPPPVRGIGTAGGFKMMVQDRRGRGLQALEAATQALVAAANQTPGLLNVFSLFNTRTPKIYADIDRVKAEMLGVTPEQVFEALEVYIGRSTSTTSTCSAAPSGSRPRPMRRSARSCARSAG